MNARTYRYLAIGVLIVALSLRLLGLAKGMNRDEGLQLELAQRGGVVDVIVNFMGDTHPPLYYLLLHFWSRISNDEVFLRLLSVVMGMATVLVVMLWLRRYSDLASILGGVFVATAPILLRYSQEIRDYPLLLLATSLVFFFASRVASKPEDSSGYLGLGLSLTLAVATHLIAIFVVAPVCIFLLMQPGILRNVRWYSLVPAIAVPVAVFLVLEFFYLHPAINPLRMDLQNSKWWVPPISRWGIENTVNILFGFSSFPWSWGDTRTLLLVALPWFAIAFDFGNWLRSLPLLIAGAVYWVQIIGYSILVTPLFLDRFLLPSLIPLFGFAALQIASIERRTLRIQTIAVCAAVSLIFSLSWAAKGAWKPVEPWKQMSIYLAAQNSGNGTVIFYPHDYTSAVEYYYPSLQPSAVLKVGPRDREGGLEQLIAARIDSINHDPANSQVFLMVRCDAYAEQGMATLRSTLSQFNDKTESGVPLTVMAFDCGSPVDTLLAGITSVLGSPSWKRTDGLFVTSRYELHKNDSAHTVSHEKR